jgi:hypothetical protein
VSHRAELYAVDAELSPPEKLRVTYSITSPLHTLFIVSDTICSGDVVSGSARVRGDAGSNQGSKANRWRNSA